MRKIGIQIAGDGGIEWMEVEAVLVGPFAVHKAPGARLLDGREVYGVTHTITGRRLVRFMFHASVDAESVASTLRGLPVDWTADHPFRALTRLQRDHLSHVLGAVCSFCGGFMLQNAIHDDAAGQA